MAKRAGRPRNELPTCYYEGYLEKRSFKDKTSRKLWTCLCGNSLFFFSEKRDNDYIEKLDLRGLISVTDDCSLDRNLDAARLNLQMKDRMIKFTAPSGEARELWKGYILSVAELSLPSSLNLLPGQIHMLKGAIEKEKERLKNIPPPAVTNSSPYITLQADMPACFLAVSRVEAEMQLEREAKRGNLLLRPGSKGNSFAVTTRQDLDGPVFRHYRVTRKHKGGFAIDVDSPVPCATLHDVINYLVDNTEGVLIPLIMEDSYEKSISFVQVDKDNGEKRVLFPPSVPPKPAAPRIPTAEPAPAEPVEGNAYVNDEQLDKDKELEESPALPPPRVEERAPKTTIMPPTPAPRKLSPSTSPPSSASYMNTPETKMRVHADAPGQIPLAAISELKLKFKQQGRCQE